jgi:hypothetical protein
MADPNEQGTESVVSSGTAPPLHVFSDECEWVIARDEADAKVVWSEHVGEPRCELTFEQLPDEELLGIWCNPDGEIDEPHAPGHAVIRRTAAEWAKRGRGYLCTTEY